MPALRLKKLRVWKVDLCAAGSNPDADIMIFKSKMPVEKRNIPKSERDKMPKTDFGGGHESFPIETQADVDAAARLVGHAPNPAAVKARIKRIARSKGLSLPADWTHPKGATSVKKIDIAKATPEQLAEYALELEKSLEEQELELEKAKTPPKSKKQTPKDAADNDEDDMPFEKSDAYIQLKKSLDDVTGKLTAVEKELSVEKGKTANAETEIKKAQNRAELVEIEKTVEQKYKSMPGTVTEIAKMLQESKSALTADSYTVLEKALAAGSEAIAKASQEVGSTSRVVGSAEQEIFKMADDGVKAGTYKTRSEGVVAVTKSHPDLAERYMTEKATARR